MEPITTGMIEQAGFEILAPRTWSVPVVFNSPHSGRVFPETFLAMSQLAEHDLRRSEDCFVDELFSACVDQGAPLLRATIARAYIDLNREPNELDQRMFDDRLPSHLNNCTARVTSGLGIVPRIAGDGRLIYAGAITLQDALTRIETFYRPYHRLLGKLLDDAHRATGLALLVDCHSMPSSAASNHQHDPVLADVILGDRFGASCAHDIVDAVSGILRAEGLKVRLNKPYAGGFITEIHGRPSTNRHAIQIEINRGLYMDEGSLTKNADFGATQHVMGKLSKKLLELVASRHNQESYNAMAAE